MPSFALFRSVQAGSLRPWPSWHIEPVRSSTIMMSSGLTPHGEHAVAFAVIRNESIPKRPAKNVFVGAFSITTTALTGSQPGIELMHFVSTVVTTSGMSWWAFFAPSDEL
jgi:hypothetical protein